MKVNFKNLFVVSCLSLAVCFIAIALLCLNMQKTHVNHEIGKQLHVVPNLGAVSWDEMHAVCGGGETGGCVTRMVDCNEPSGNTHCGYEEITATKTSVKVYNGNVYDTPTTLNNPNSTLSPNIILTTVCYTAYVCNVTYYDADLECFSYGCGYAEIASGCTAYNCGAGNLSYVDDGVCEDP